MSALNVGRVPTTSPVRPSLAFFLVLTATVIGGLLCTVEGISRGWPIFVFVLPAWVLSLIFHEFAHAFVAWRGGDSSIPSKGYLSLDPRRYADPLTSIAIPLVVLIIGGIGLPGGAVWINRSAIRSRAVASLMSLAGPFTNLAFAAACLIPLSLGLVEFTSQPLLTVALGFLGFLQILAFVLNMLPLPGLDGFGALEPFLPRSILTAIAPVRGWGTFALILALFWVDPLRDQFLDAVQSVMGVFGVDETLTAEDLDRAGIEHDLLPNRRYSLHGVGFRLFRFWL